MREVQRMEDLLEDVPPEAQERTLREAQSHLDAYEQPAAINSRSDSIQPELASETNAIPNDVPARDILDNEYVPPSSAVSSKQSEVLERTGLSEGYNQAVKEYQELPSRVFADGDETIDADVVIEGFDSEINGLENVIRCVRG